MTETKQASNNLGSWRASTDDEGRMRGFEIRVGILGKGKWIRVLKSGMKREYVTCDFSKNKK